MLRRRLNGRIGDTGVPARLAAGLWLASALGAACAWGVKLYLGLARPLVDGAVILAMYCLVYFLATIVTDVPEAQSVLRQVLRKRPPPVSPAPPA